MQEQATNLSDLRVGDKVAIRVGYSDSYSIHTVREISARGIITIDTGAKYRANGSPMDKGSKWHRPAHIEPVTDEIRRTIKKSRLVSSLNGLNINYWKTVDLETLEAIAALIWKPEAKNNG